MIEISARRSWRFLLLFSSISLYFFAGFSVEPPSSKNATNSDTHSTFGGSKQLKVLIILCVVVATAVISFFLFKLWQKKKRQEQYARLLKLFEEDDELEVELGLRD